MIQLIDDENQILITIDNNDLYFKAMGHITANLCFPLRDMVLKRLSLFTCPFEIFFDLSETKYMDSTFLGILVGLEKKLHGTFGNHLYIINPNEISVKLMKNMGLDRFLKIVCQNVEKVLHYELFDEDVQVNELEKCKIVLTSHKELSALSDENKKKFEILQDVLEKEIKDKQK